MRRIKTSTKAPDLFGAGKHGFKDGNPLTGDAPTQLEADWFNQFQEEAATVVEKAGIVLDGAKHDQLYDAIMALIVSQLPSVPAASPFSRSVHGLVIKNNTATPTTKMDITFDDATLSNAALTLGKLFKNGNLTVDTAISGVGGLDVGTMAASSWYHAYLVSDGTLIKPVISLSSVAPNAAVTNVYPLFLRCGAIRTAANGQLVGTIQRGRSGQYVVGGPNLTSLPVIASGAGTSSPSIVGHVPTTASRIRMMVSNLGGNAGSIGSVVGVAPNSSGQNTGNFVYVGSSAATSGYVPGTKEADFVLEGTTVYYSANAAAPAALYCLGWEDDI
jgi:hypothetical protein